MGGRGYAWIGGLCSVLGACDLASAGLDANDLAQQLDASEPLTDAALDAPDTLPAPRDASQDAAPAEEAADAAAPVDACPLPGTYALTLEADVTWEGTRVLGLVPLIVAGQGKVKVQSLMELGDAPTHPVSVRLCGLELPEFNSSYGELHGGDFAAQVWETVPSRWSTRADIGCAESGCGFDVQPVTMQLGIDVPANSTWPAPRDTVATETQRDDDGDGVPGVRLQLRAPADPPMYQYPPTSFLRAERVSEIQLAIRLAATLDGMVSGCETRSGMAPGMKLQTHALACRVAGGGPCNQEELGFITDSVPVWAVQSASFRATRVPTPATCADARAH
jgi:hypothetical protein